MITEKQAHVIEIYEMSQEDKLTVLALQGIINRDGPLVFAEARFWNWPEADGKWMEYLSEKKGFSFNKVDSIKSLIDLYPGLINGLVVWDPEVPWTRWIAVTMAGVKNLLPVAPASIENYDLPVVEDLRGRWSGNEEAATWAVRNLVWDCNRQIAYSIEETWSGCTIDSIDYAVNQRAFVYHFAHGSSKGKERMWEIPLMHELLSRIGPNAPIFGWGENEDEYCDMISCHDNYIMCAEAPNLSFMAAVPCDKTDWTQKARKDPSTFKLEDVHYVSINMSEGDSPKMHYAIQGGAWFDPDRGKVPVNWGAQPMCIKYFPALLEYFWDTATENDYFVGGASGAGYTYPNRMANPDTFFRQTGEYFKKADMSETDAWLHFNRPTYERYAELSGLKAFCLPGGPYGVTTLNNGKSAVFLRGNSGLNYFNSDGTAKDLAEAIKSNCVKRGAPSFSVALVVPDRDNPAAQGGYTCADIIELIELLGPGYKVVTMQELAELALQAVASGKTPDCEKPGYSEWDDVRKEEMAAKE